MVMRRRKMKTEILHLLENLEGLPADLGTGSVR